MSDPHNEGLPKEIESLVSRHLDGELGHEEHQRLQGWINERPENARTFVDLAMLHDRLLVEHAQATGRYDGQIAETSRVFVASQRSQKRLRWAIGAFSSIAALLLVSFFAIQMIQGSPAMAAETQLERLIEVARKSSSRTYLITALELRGKKRGRANRNRSDDQNHAKRRKGKMQAPVDGALLHVRGENSYVLIRRFENGDQFITGSDGKTSWSVPPKGRIRVSDDVERFRGGVPGNQHAIPFINLQDDLKQLRDAYDIQWLESEFGIEEPRLGQRCLVATKKSAQHRGPKYVEIWFDLETGTITEMLLDKLPQGKGGPKTVLLELVDQPELPEAFFEHTSHHDSNRKIKHDRN